MSCGLLCKRQTGETLGVRLFESKRPQLDQIERRNDARIALGPFRPEKCVMNREMHIWNTHLPHDRSVHKLDGAPYDYHRLLYTFRVKSRLKDVGIYRPRHRWEFSGAIQLTPRP